MRISDWSSDVCSSDLARLVHHLRVRKTRFGQPLRFAGRAIVDAVDMLLDRLVAVRGEEGAVRRLIDPDQFLYRPGAARELGHCAVCPAKIGRASCRERVCQYV